MLLILAFSLIRNKSFQEPPPFVATIITPDQLQEKEHFKVPPLPKNLPAPEKYSALPSSRVPATKSHGSADSRKSAPPSNAGRVASTPEAAVPPHAAVAPPQRQEPGLAQEQLRTLNKGNEGEDIRKEIRASSPAGQSSNSAKTARDILRDKDIYKDVIAKYSTKESGNTKNDTGITFDTKEYKYYGYMQRLREKIEGAWKYPAEAAESKLNGELYIRFTIKRDGRLGAVELVHTSGYTILDDAAVRALKDADPYWPLPDSWNEDSLTITGRFVYYFYNTYIE